MVRRHADRLPSAGRGGRASQRACSVRIIGGQFRGRRIRWSGDPGVRPMKDRVREAIFNVLGSTVLGRHALDLFAGTGSLGLEALSRGAPSATFLELDRRTCQILRQNVQSLGIEQRANVILVDTFSWARGHPSLPPHPWLVFCSPPYSFYDQRKGDMRELIGRLLAQAPHGSVWVLEAPDSLDLASLVPNAARWQARRYRPCQIAFYWGEC